MYSIEVVQYIHASAITPRRRPIITLKSSSPSSPTPLSLFINPLPGFNVWIVHGLHTLSSPLPLNQSRQCFNHTMEAWGISSQAQSEPRQPANIEHWSAEKSQTCTMKPITTTRCTPSHLSHGKYRKYRQAFSTSDSVTKSPRLNFNNLSPHPILRLDVLAGRHHHASPFLSVWYTVLSYVRRFLGSNYCLDFMISMIRGPLRLASILSILSCYPKIF